MYSRIRTAPCTQLKKKLQLLGNRVNQLDFDHSKMGELIQFQVSPHLFSNDGGFSKRFRLTQEVSIDSTIAIAFGVVGTLLAIYGLFIAYNQLKMMHLASRWSKRPSVFCLTSDATEGF
jgi:hypothetical protein